MKQVVADVVFPQPSELGEGSLWDAARGLLYWVDIAQHKVFAFDPQSRSNLAYDVGEDVGTVVLTQNDKLLLALRSGFAVLDPTTGALQRLEDPESDKPHTRFNDGKCDPRGRFWAGTIVEGSGKRGDGGLYCLHTDLTIEKKLDGVSCSNGLCWSRDQRRFFYIDTPTYQVWAFDYDPDTAQIAGRRTVVELPKSVGAPDGMTIDEEDRLWVALFDGGKVIRIDPASGAIDFEVLLPEAGSVTSCAFGGPRLDQLYVTTARAGLDAERRKREPRAGSLHVAAVPFRGVPAFRFARDL